MFLYVLLVNNIENRGRMDMNIAKRIICMISLMVVFALLKNMEVQAAGTSFATATQINVNTDVTDNYSEKGESDYYKFTLSSPGYISVTFSHKMVESGIWTNKLYYGRSIINI